MRCGTKGAEIQKLSDLRERPHSLSLFLYLILSLPLFKAFSRSLSLLLHFDVVLAQVLILLSLHTHAHILGNTGWCMHKIHTLTSRNVWESPSGYLCNLHLKLVRGQEGSRPRGLNVNSGEAG